MLQNSETESSDFEAVFNGFMDGMFEWESKFFDRKIDNFHNDSEPGLEGVMEAEILELLSKYVLKVGRNYDRAENLVCRNPPDYNRRSDKIEVDHVSPNKVLVKVQKLKGLESTFRLTFLKKNGRFMLSKRELYDGEKWRATYI